MTDSVSGDHKWYGENRLRLENSSTITDLTVTITIVKTKGLSYYDQYTNFWNGAIQSEHETANGVVTYTFALKNNKTIVAGSWDIVAQTDGNGTLHPTSGDRWTVTSTSGGKTRTLSGWF